MSKPEDFEDDDIEDVMHPDEDDMFARKERSGPNRGHNVVSGFVRRAIENTVGSVHSSGTISKEAISYVLQQGDKGRKEIVRIVAKVGGDFLRHTDISSDVVKILTNVQVDLNASVRFKQNPDGTLAQEVEHESDVALGTEPDEPLDGGEPPVEEEDEA